MSAVYQHPKHYGIAFCWRDVGAEVDVFKDVIRQYSRIPVARMLEVGCSLAPHLPELANRGYAYVGLNASCAMLAYAHERARALQASATFVGADMRHFHLAAPTDFAFVLLGSLFVQSTADLTAHFGAMSRALKPGAFTCWTGASISPPMLGARKPGLSKTTGSPSRPPVRPA